MPETIFVQFDPETLPAWAQAIPFVVEHARNVLAYRVRVCQFGLSPSWKDVLIEEARDGRDRRIARGESAQPPQHRPAAPRRRPQTRGWRTMDSYELADVYLDRISREIGPGPTTTIRERLRTGKLKPMTFVHQIDRIRGRIPAAVIGELCGQSVDV